MEKISPLVTGNNVLDIGTGFGIVIKALINRVTSGTIIIADWGPESAGKTNPHSPGVH